MTPDSPRDPRPSRALIPGRGTFSYTDEGRGPPLLALHGLPGSARDFRWLAPALSDVRFIRLEQPAFGATPRATEPGWTLAARTRFVLDALDALGIDEVCVLGHSMGGALAMSVAAAAPARVRRLALLASVGMSVHRLARRSRRIPDVARLLESPLVRVPLMPLMRRGMRSAGFPASTPDPEILQTTRIFMAMSFPDIRHAARNVHCPTLLSWAEDDRLVEPAIALELASVLPRGPRLSFPSGGHNIQKTRAVELGDALRAWVNEAPQR